MGKVVKENIVDGKQRREKSKYQIKDESTKLDIDYRAYPSIINFLPERGKQIAYPDPIISGNGPIFSTY